MINLLLAKTSSTNSAISELVSLFSLITIKELIILVVCILICYIIAKEKNMRKSDAFWGILFILGILIVLLLPANFIQCKSCGYKFNPKLTHKCPACKTDIIECKEKE